MLTGGGDGDGTPVECTATTPMIDLTGWLMYNLHSLTIIDGGKIQGRSESQEMEGIHGLSLI